MYLDHRPPNVHPNCPRKVTVIEVDKDFPCDIDETVASATRDDGGTIWIVFSDEPRRAWDFTERSFRSTLATRNRNARAQDRAAAEQQPSRS